MSTIITRSTGSNPKGAPLTAGELDSNFINLNADKVESTRAINTTAGDLTGGGDLSGDRTLGLASTGISAGTVQNSATQVTPLTLDIKGRVTAVGTPVTIAPDFSNVANKPTTLSGYGITDAQATITGAATTIDTEDLTASKVLVSNASGKVAASDISTTTLGYLDATSSVQGQLDAKQATTAKNAANGYAGLDANAKLPTSLLPALAISEYLGSAADQTARLALTGEKGDWCSQADNGKVYVITGDDPTDNASWTALTYPVTPGITLNGTSIAPGDTATITAATTNTLTIGTGLSGTSFSGSAATTIAIDSTVVTLEGTQTLTNKTLTSPVISGGTANNVAIGGTTPAAGAFTTLSSTGNTTLGDASGDTLTINAGTTTFAGTGQRITGDFSNATVANRLIFQTSTVNGITAVEAIPNGTSFGASLSASNSSSDPGNSSFASLGIPNANTDVRVQSGIRGTGTFLPMTFYTGGREAMRIGATSGSDLSTLGIGYTSLSGVGEYGLAVSGKVGIGTSSTYSKLHLKQATNGSAVTGFVIENSANDNRLFQYFDGSNDEWRIGATYGSTGAFKPITWWTSDARRLTLDASGNLGLGVTPSAWGSYYKAIDLDGSVSTYSRTTASSSHPTVGFASGAYADNTNWLYKVSSRTVGRYELFDGTHAWYNAPSGTAGNAISFTQAMTLDTSGRLMIGYTSNSAGEIFGAYGQSRFGSSGGVSIDSSYTNAVTIKGDSILATSRAALHLGDNATGASRQWAVVNGNTGYGALDFVVSTAANTNPLVSGSTAMTLTLAGIMRVPATYSNNVGTVRAMYVDSSGNYGYNASVLSAKTNVNPLSDVSWLLHLNPVSFNYREKDKEGNYTDVAKKETWYGLIADDAVNVNENICFRNNDGELAGIAYEMLISPMLKAIQELHQEIELLKAKVN